MLHRYTPEYNPIEMAFGWIKRRLIQIGPIPDKDLVCDGPTADVKNNPPEALSNYKIAVVI